MKKTVCFFVSLLFLLVTGLSCAYAADEFTVSQVEEMLQNIDTLQQMQDKRSKYTASGHYDINTTNTTTIFKHNSARTGYEAYVADMFEKRAEAQKAYDALSDEEKAQLDSSLVAKLSDELPTSYLIKEYAVTPANNEYSYEAIDAEPGYAYEIGNYMISGSIPQSFILVDTSDGATSWTPSGEYIYGESNYIVTYCCDKETGLEYGTHYKQVNLEDSGYFDEAEAQSIRAIIESSYPFVTMDEMKEKLKSSGMDGALVDSLNRADLISAVQMAVWSYANVNDAAAEGLEYFASIDIPRNTGIYFTPLHDYTNEMWEWYPGKRTRTFDTRVQYRVNTLAEYLCNLEPVTPSHDQIVISELEVVKTELIDEDDGLYHITMYIALNGGGNEEDELKIHATSYSQNEDGTVSVTERSECRAECIDGIYTITTHAKDGDMIEITVDGKQKLSKGAYFYDPEGGREKSQSLVGMSEGVTSVSATKNTYFIAELANIPVQDIEIPEAEKELKLKSGETVQLAVTVKPENATNKEIIFSTSDMSVASVDEKGNIVAVGEGTAVITVISADKPSVKKEITITVAPENTKPATKHYIVFGKTEKIGWYSVSLDGGESFQIVFGNSNLEVAEGTELIIRANDVFGDPFIFYINGKAVKTDENGYVRVTVDGYMLIGALGIPDIEIPDAEESLNLFQRIIKAFKDFFAWIASWFK
ncbi:MAG: Ig domain-containing protein [Clostridia bacterium]|nr:Ig domain-containing protein [Clostridia bacterium]